MMGSNHCRIVRPGFLNLRCIVEHLPDHFFELFQNEISVFVHISPKNRTGVYGLLYMCRGGGSQFRFLKGDRWRWKS